MLRTIASGSNLVKKSETIVKVVRGTFIRSFSVECAKRRLNHSLSLRRNQPLVQHLQWHYQIRHYASDLPPHIRVTLPALSPTMENGTIVSWEKKEGDKLNEGDLLAEIETDKATMGFETPEEGYLAKILIPAGTKGVPIGKLVCIIVEKEADIAAFKDFKDDAAPVAAAAPSAAKAPAPAAAPPAAPSAPRPAPPPPAAAPADTGRVYASPMAKRLAEQRNIRLQGKGTGLYGSITSEDLDKLGVAAGGAPAARATPAPGTSYIDIPLTNMRTVIAKRLLQSKQQLPHYYITMDINVDRIMALREKANKKLEKSKVKVTLNDFVIKAAAVACKQVPEANAAWMDTFIRQFNNVDISIAVATDKGLLTPIIFGADVKGILEINREMKTLAQKARDGKLQPHEFQGGTFSISNLGMFGVAHFCAIINPPQCCILAVGGTQLRLVEANTPKGYKSSNFMSVTLSSDHRVVDGAIGARWLQAFRDNLEDPGNMVM